MVNANPGRHWLAVLSYSDESEAIAIANDTPYGLGGYVFSLDRAHAMAGGAQLRAGRIFCNGAPANYVAPLGGYNQSGNGREMGVFGLEEYLQVKAMIGFDEPVERRNHEHRLIGLGAMGGPLARRLLAGHTLHVWDINAAAVERFEKLGARPAPTAPCATRSRQRPTNWAVTPTSTRWPGFSNAGQGSVSQAPDR